MTTREGSLEAPTRHPLDWQNPKFYDKADLESEMERTRQIEKRAGRRGRRNNRRKPLKTGRKLS
jgi:hypothetical protein